MSDSQNGTIWSRGLPESWVTIVRRRSTVCIRSQITRNGLSGTASEVRRGIHSRRKSALTAATSRAAVVSPLRPVGPAWRITDRKSTRLNSSHSQISYAVFCLKKKKKTIHLRFIYQPEYQINIKFTSKYVGVD